MGVAVIASVGVRVMVGVFVGGFGVAEDVGSGDTVMIGVFDKTEFLWSFEEFSQAERSNSKENMNKKEMIFDFIFVPYQENMRY